MTDTPIVVERLLRIDCCGDCKYFAYRGRGLD